MAVFNVDDALLAQWTPAHENLPRWLGVIVLEVFPPVEGKDQLYRVQTNMGVTMVLPETALSKYPPPENTGGNGEP